MPTPYTEMLQERVVQLEKMNDDLYKINMEGAAKAKAEISALKDRLSDLEDADDKRMQARARIVELERTLMEISMLPADKVDPCHEDAARVMARAALEGRLANDPV